MVPVPRMAWAETTLPSRSNVIQGVTELSIVHLHEGCRTRAAHLCATELAQMSIDQNR